MNKEYLNKLFNDYKDNFLESEEKIESLEDLQDYILATIILNFEYDFDIHIDKDKFLNTDEKRNNIELEINNGRMFKLSQTETDKSRLGITLETLDHTGQVCRRDLIDEGDFVMLMNYYMYIKDYDIKDDFINRDGTNERTELENEYEM